MQTTYIYDTNKTYLATLLKLHTYSNSYTFTIKDFIMGFATSKTFIITRKITL